MTSGSENGKIPGGHAKLTEISGSLKFHIHSLRNDTWKTRFVTDSWRTVSGGYRPSVRFTHTRQPPGGTLSSSLPQGFILSTTISILPI